MSKPSPDSSALSVPRSSVSSNSRPMRASERRVLRRVMGGCLSVVLLAGAWGCGASLKNSANTADTSERALGFALEPARPEEQFALARRYELGNGVQADDYLAEYWTWRAARQGHEPALAWLRKRADLDERDQPGMQVFREFRPIKKEYPSAQLWLAVAQQGNQRTPDELQEAASLVREALPEIREKALRGDAWSKYLVGMINDLAFSDPTNALSWYREAAELGHVLAQDALAHLYESGRGTRQDSAEAAKWFHAAAEQGYAPAATTLGWLYDQGRGVPRDPVRAKQWFAAAAAHGDAVAQANLGIMYDRGRGTAQDPAEAARWYLKAAEQGIPLAQNNLGVLYDRGRGVARDENEAVRWLRSAALAGYVQATNNLGVILARKGIAEGDPGVAKAWVVRAAVQGDPVAQFGLATMYERGTGVGQDPAQAARWYLEAAKQGHTQAQTNLALLYHAGRGVPQNDAEAARLLQAAAMKESAEAQYHLGAMYQAGAGVPKDAREALEWYRRAARQGHAAARERVGQLECETSATTLVFGVQLRCTTRDGLRAAIRHAGLSVIQEAGQSSFDVYEGSAVLNLKHVMRVGYTSQGRFALSIHEFPAPLDQQAFKRTLAEFTAVYGEPQAQPKSAQVEAGYQWTLKDGIRVELVHGKAPAKSYVVFRVPENSRDLEPVASRVEPSQLQPAKGLAEPDQLVSGDVFVAVR